MNLCKDCKYSIRFDGFPSLGAFGGSGMSGYYCSHGAQRSRVDGEITLRCADARARHSLTECGYAGVLWEAKK